jgi:hypothetical protein
MFICALQLGFRGRVTAADPINRYFIISEFAKYFRGKALLA